MVPSGLSSDQTLCQWTEGPRKFAIHLAPGVIGPLGAESKMAFKRVPRRGLEIGGILLGRKETEGEITTFSIEGFQPIESEHRTGPSYLLSESDYVLLQAALAKNSAACIGLYRSHTRSDRPRLQEADTELFERCFEAGDALYLVLGPVAGVADLFVRTNSDLRCVHEFALASTRESILALGQVVRPNPENPDSPAREGVETSRPGRSRRRDLPLSGSGVGDFGTRLDQPQPSLLRGPKAKAVLHSSIRQGKWRLTAAVVFLALAATAAALSYFHSLSAVRSAGLREPEYLHLTVEQAGTALRIVWDRNSPAIRSATRGVLHIDDGTYHGDQSLAPSQLNSGRFLYEPKSTEERFRLDLYSVEPNATGTVAIITMSRPLPPAPSFPPGASSANPATPTPAPLPQPGLHRAPLPAVPLPKQEIRTSSPKPERPADAPTSPQEIPLPIASERSKPEPSPEKQNTSTPDPGLSIQATHVRVSAEPVPASRFSRVLGKVPLFRRLGKPSKAEAPVPLYQAQPLLKKVPKEEELAQPVTVNVKVNVAESGVVRNAEVIEYGDPPNWTLADAALAAARRWTFQPARVEDTPVSSSVILHFHFTP
jgi:TonB family protein